MIERRRYGRVGFLCQVELSAFPDGPMLEGSSLDLSLGGVGVVTASALSVGQVVAVTFHLREDGLDVQEKVIGRVANLKADVDANRIGLEFLEPLRETAQPVLVRRLVRV